MDELLNEIRKRWQEAKLKAGATASVAHNSYGAGYDLGYFDALGEILEFADDAKLEDGGIAT